MKIDVRNKNYWESSETLVDILAELLYKGRLILVLGAGVSQAYGLPNWSNLLNKAFQLHGLEKESGDPYKAGDQLYFDCKHKGMNFSSLIQRALYEDFWNQSDSFIDRIVLNSSSVSDWMTEMLGDTGIHPETLLARKFSEIDQNDLAYFKGSHNDSFQSFLTTIRDIIIKDTKRKLLLNALGALCMGSRRGNVSHIITLNFDDLLEKHLEYYGFSVDSIDCLPAWRGNADIEVYHPHGLLTCEKQKEAEREIVLAQDQYDRFWREQQCRWIPLIRNVMQSNICLFIGLSGEDGNMRQILKQVSDQHVAVDNAYPYWGVRLGSLQDTKKESDWSRNGIFQHALSSYDELPAFIFSIAQRALKYS